MKNLLNKVLLTLIIGNIFIFTEIAQNNISYGKNTLDSEILKCLPKGAKIAVLRDSEGERLGMINADVDGDGEKEVIIAYYTEPHKYTNESFFRRAHVKILKKVGKRFVEVWDSGGWGSEFGGRIDLQKMGRSLKHAYLRNLFDVYDITGDGKPEIIFTRSSFLAEGTRAEVWTWDGKGYKQIFVGDNLFRVIIDSGGCYKIISEFDYKGIKRKFPLIYKWNGTYFRKIKNQEESKLKTN